MYAEERQHEIVTRTRELGRVSVADLAARYDVTPETIRRDLDALAGRGLVSRVHGGAVPADKLLLGVAVRRELGVEQKGLTEADIAEAINANGVHYVVMQPGFWTDLEAMQRFERVMSSEQFEEVARIATPANHKAHETELVIYRNKGAVSPRRQVTDIELKIINRRISAD